MAVTIFWCITLILVVCALWFVIPPLWIKGINNNISKNESFSYSVFSCLFVTAVGYFLYLNYGTAAQLSSYYEASNVQKRRDLEKIRPLYARLQSELAKTKLNMELDKSNIELILHFATANSEAQQGILEPSIKTLLYAILKVMPQQVTALNLLAVDAYKKEDYAQAISNWQLILQQFTSDMRGSDLEKVLKNKIQDTKDHLKVFESRRTK